MKPILFLLCLWFSLPSVAQRFSAGVRTGASYWFLTNHNREFDVVSDFSWAKSVYARNEGKGRFAFELDVDHNRFNTRLSDHYRSYFEPAALNKLDYRGIVDVVTGKLSAQFRITNVEAKFRNYAGINLSYGREMETRSFNVQDQKTGEWSRTTQHYDTPRAFWGLNNFTSYAINKRFNVNAVVSLDIYAPGLFSTYPAERSIDSRLTLNVGCGYTF